MRPGGGPEPGLRQRNEVRRAWSAVGPPVSGNSKPRARRTLRNIVGPAYVARYDTSLQSQSERAGSTGKSTPIPSRRPDSTTTRTLIVCQSIRARPCRSRGGPISLAPGTAVSARRPADWPALVRPGQRLGHIPEKWPGQLRPDSRQSPAPESGVHHEIVTYYRYVWFSYVL